MSMLVNPPDPWQSDGDGAPNTYEYVDEIEWGTGGSHRYDLTRFYRRRVDGALFFATDAGEDMTPFEDTTEADLTPIRRLQDLYNHVRVREGRDPSRYVVDQINRVTWKLAEILTPEQRAFGAIKHAA
jgi:hypothetical protein